MAQYDELPVYKATYDLLSSIFMFTREFKKEFKYTVGESLKKETIELDTLKKYNFQDTLFSTTSILSYSHKTGLPILPKIRIYHNSVGLLFSIQKKHTSSGLEVGGIVNNFDMKLKKGFWYVKGTNNRYNEVWKKTEPFGII